MSPSSRRVFFPRSLSVELLVVCSPGNSLSLAFLFLGPALAGLSDISCALAAVAFEEPVWWPCFFEPVGEPWYSRGANDCAYVDLL